MTVTKARITMDERKGISEHEAAATGKLVAHQEDNRWQLRNKRQCNNQPANKRQTGCRFHAPPKNHTMIK
jgi:hypothetical protein